MSATIETLQKQKKVSVGIAAHGVVEIGVSAHGIVAIGIVTHGWRVKSQTESILDAVLSVVV